MKLVLSGLRRLDLCEEEPIVKTTGAGAELFEVLACGICRTDAKMWEQGHRDLIFPRVLGHEFVVRDGSGVRSVVWPGNCCGECGYCTSGRENLCDEMKITGFHTDGGFASSVWLDRKNVIPLPDELDSQLACFAEPVGCVINLFEKANYHRGDQVLIYGAGTVGLIIALYATHLGMAPCLIEKNETKIEAVSSFLTKTTIPCIS